MKTVTWHALAAYNNGKLVSQTFDLTEFTDAGEYVNALQEWLESVGEEEYILCDYEGIPKQYVSEYSLDPEVFDYLAIGETLGFDLVDAGLILGIPLESIEEAHLGKYDSLEDYAYDRLHELYELDKLPSIITCHIDWEGVARDLSVETLFENGYVFSANW
jgi:antirestriction protein